MRIAIVTPWFGAELIGGAERQAWDLAFALKRAGADVEVLTTCCRSFHDDWSANYHRPGSSNIEGVSVRRFRVDERDRVAFSRANSALLSLQRRDLRRDRAPLPREKTDAFISESIRSRALVYHLQQQGADYGAFIFIPYPYGTTFDGVPLVADRAFLQPCLHDEAYAYLDAVRELFRSARGLLFNSEGEKNVAASIFGPWIHARAAVPGESIEVTTPPAEPIAIKGFVPQRARYLLFLGRGDRTKNLHLAIDAFTLFRERRRASALQLVIAGPHARDLHSDVGIVDLGAVREDEKAALLQNARALVQPSLNESFSRAVYEAWNFRRPVVVHADCVATSEIVADSGGGWLARTIEEWAGVFATIDESSDAEIDGLGARGRAVALRVGTWDDVARRTLDAIATRLAKRNAEIVPLEDWSGPRPPKPRYDDGSINVISLAPLREGDVENLVEILGVLGKKSPVRLFVFEESLKEKAQERLVAVATELGLDERLVLLGDDVASQYAALRDAHVACAFGAPLERRDRVLEAMWFDLPIVAYEDPIARELIEPCGVICGPQDPSEAAMVLYLAATDTDLRGKILSQTRRVRTCEAGENSFRSTF